MPQARSAYHHGDLRDALITTGLELTRNGGPDALRLREAARRIGVSPNAAYRHFENHAALLAAVAAEIQDRMAQVMREQLSPAAAVGGGEEAESATNVDLAVASLKAVGLGYVNFAISEPGWFELAFFAPAGIARPDGQTPPPLTLLLDALDQLVEAGALDPESRQGAEWSCWSAVHGFAELAIHGPLAQLPRDQARTLGERAVNDIIAGVLRN